MFQNINFTANNLGSNIDNTGIDSPYMLSSANIHHTEPPEVVVEASAPELHDDDDDAGL